MSYRLEQIVQEWQEKQRINDEMFDEFTKQEGWKKYKFEGSNANKKGWHELHKACKKCIFTQINKYYDRQHFDGEKLGNRFTVPCNGIPKDYIKPEVLNYLGLKKDSQEYKDILSTRDPVEWARENCINELGGPWEARWYQEIMLRCTSSRVVFRCGRRCLIKGTLIQTPEGNKKIEDLKPGDIVYGYDPDTDKVFETPVEEIWDQGIQEVVDLTRKNKVIASCTLDHRWHTTHEKGAKDVKRVHQFYKGIGITRRFVKSPLGEISEPHAYSIGALLGDGCSKEKGNKIYISSAEKAVIEKISSELKCLTSPSLRNNFTWTLGETFAGGNHKTISCNYYNQWCKGRYAHEKVVDLDVIKTWDRDSCLRFLAGLLDTGGSLCFSEGVAELDFRMQTLSVIKSIQYLIKVLFQVDLDVKVDDREKYKNGPVHYLTLKSDLHCKRIIDELRPYIQVSSKKQQITEHAQEKLEWLSVVVDESSKRKEQCYDISIGTKDNLYLLANGLVTHNTGKSDALAVLTLFYAFTQPFYARDPVSKEIIKDKNGQPMQQKTKILIITPRQTHADNFMAKVLGFLERNPTLQNSVVTQTKSPYYLVKFANGSRITCLTAGSGTGSAGTNIRSFDGDVIILDEGNYLTEADLQATRAILMTNLNSMLRVSSTPKGIQDFFWEMCEDNPGYKEFHFPSTCIPHWPAMKHTIYTDVDTEDEFFHEYMAEFSASASGVFRMDLIQKSKRDFRYGPPQRKLNCKYSLGVDWNNDAGTEIYVTEFDEITGISRGVNAVNVPKSEWTQLKALEVLIDLIKAYYADVICVDEGHGHGIIEMLKRYCLVNAKGHPAIGAVLDNLIVYNFSSKIEVVDPVKGIKIKKAAKPYLVQSSVRKFEDEMFEISMHDKLLEQQLSHYEIANVSPTGMPSYKMSKANLGDHRLDAMMLSIVGLRIKYGNEDKRNMVVDKVTYIGQKKSETFKRDIKPRNEFEDMIFNNTEFFVIKNRDEKDPKRGPVPSRSVAPTPQRTRSSLPGIHSRTPIHSRGGRR